MVPGVVGSNPISHPSTLASAGVFCVSRVRFLNVENPVKFRLFHEQRLDSLASKFQIGDEVLIEFGGRSRSATVISPKWSEEDQQYNYRCEYETNSGTKRSTSRLEEEVSAE